MSFCVPLFDLNFDQAEERAVVDVLRSKWISTGPKTAEFETRFAELLGVKRAIALSNCTVALHLSLVALGIGPGDEVILPSLTFVATANAIRYVGAIPIFCDVCGPEDLTINPDEVESLITPRTKALMLMHYGGFPSRLTELAAIAARYNLRIIEDACHGPLSEWNGKKLGTFGDIGCFSFFSNKNMSTGEGGMIVTDNDALAEQCRLLRSHGMTTLSYDRARGHGTSYDVVALGYNYRMDDIHAAIGIAQLEKLPGTIRARADLRTQYLRRLSEIDEIVIPFCDHVGTVSNYILPIVLKAGGAGRREEVRADMARAGVQTSVHYPPVHRFSIYQEYAAKLPQTEFVADSEITLPLYPSLTLSQLEQVVSALKQALS